MTIRKQQISPLKLVRYLFLSLVKSIFESSEETPIKLHTAISLLAQGHSINSKLQATELLRKVNLSVSRDTRILWDSQVRILETLQMYPYLSEYIELHQQNKRYSRNGGPLQAKYYKPTPSYANWVTQKLERVKRSWLVGIEEIFPQDVGHPATSLPNITGIKPGNRRYKILKAAEIIK